MSGEVISFDARKASAYIERAFAGFLIDPAETDYQRGYLSALLTLYTEGLGQGDHDDRLNLLKAQVCR